VLDKSHQGVKVWSHNAAILPSHYRRIAFALMADEERRYNRSLLDKLISILLESPWLDVLSNMLMILPKIIQGRSYGGLYEALEYESTLELKDRAGKWATFKRDGSPIG
jgi:hypothetical protein